MGNKLVTFLTAGDCYSPSSRYRSYQYFPWLRRHGYEPRGFPLYRGLDSVRLRRLKGPNLKKVFRGIYMLHCYLRRISQLPSVKNCDLLVVEHEIFTWLPFICDEIIVRTLGNKPLIADYDDATYLKYAIFPLLKHKIPKIMARADSITAGSRVLKNYASRFNRSVTHIPTTIDLNRYQRLAKFNNDKFVIGWIGGPQNVRHLELIGPALRELNQSFPIVLRCLGAPSNFQVSRVPTEVYPWSWDSEIDLLLSFDVGINPLDNDGFSQGKCGFKLIQYMACGLPVVASPVGANQDIVAQGSNGYLASDQQEWIDSLRLLYSDKNLRLKMGALGREKVEKSYSVQAVAPNLREIYQSLI
jgi:glycosyltransferase involved in cell wall biosynthesis